MGPFEALLDAGRLQKAALVSVLVAVLCFTSSSVCFSI